LRGAKRRSNLNLLIKSALFKGIQIASSTPKRDFLAMTSYVKFLFPFPLKIRILDMTMTDEYQISVKLTKGEIATYNFHHIRWLLRLDGLGLCLLLIAAYFSFTSPDAGIRNALNILVFWGVLLLAIGLSQPFILFLQIYIFQSPAVASQMLPKIYMFNDSGIHIDTGERRVTTPWSRVTEIKDIDRLLLIYTSPKLAYIIPKRYFSSPEEQALFIALLLGRIKSEA
jgi:hypothetical protein